MYNVSEMLDTLSKIYSKCYKTFIKVHLAIMHYKVNKYQTLCGRLQIYGCRDMILLILADKLQTYF